MTRTVRQHARPKVYLWPDGTAAGRVDLSPYCTSFTYDQAIQQPVGHWSLSILPYQGVSLIGGVPRGPAHIGRSTALERMCRPNSIISIGFDEPGGICFGIVDEVRRARGLAGPNASLGLHLAGSDFGKVLGQDHIVHASLAVKDQKDFFDKVSAATSPKNALLGSLPGLWGPETESGGKVAPVFTGASLQDVIDWLLDTAPSMQIPLLAANGGTGRANEYISTLGSIATWNNGRVWSEAPQSWDGDLWSFLKRLVDEDFYEIFLQSVPDLVLHTPIPKLRLIVRPKPFDESGLTFLHTTASSGLTWENLRTGIDGLASWEIPQEEVLDEQLGITDADVYSYFLVTSSGDLLGNSETDKEGLFYPAVDLFALQRAGLRAMNGRLELLASNLTDKQRGTLDYSEVPSEIRDFRNRLVNWYRLSEYFEAGSLTVAGRDRYRCGDPVTLPWRVPMRGLAGPSLTTTPMKYYGVSTTHEWKIGSPYTTTWRLMRGHNAATIQQAQSDILRVGGPLGNPSMFAETT